MLYYANFKTNTGTSYSSPIIGENFRQLKSDILSIAKANTFQEPTNSTTVWVEDEKGTEIYRANIYVSQKKNYYIRRCE